MQKENAFFFFIAEREYLRRQPKVQISERKAKKNSSFCFLFQARVLSATAKGTKKMIKSTKRHGFFFV